MNKLAQSTSLFLQKQIIRNIKYNNIIAGAPLHNKCNTTLYNTPIFKTTSISTNILPSRLDIRYFGSRNYDNDSSNNQRTPIFPSRGSDDSYIERLAALLVSVGVVGLLIYVFYDGADEMIVNNLVYKQTVDELRNSKSVKNIFGQDFTSKGLGIRSHGKFQYHHTINKNGENIVLINYVIESEKGLIGHVEVKCLRKSTFSFEIKVLKIRYGNNQNKTITIYDDILPKKIPNRIINFLSFFGINNNKPTSTPPSTPTTPSTPSSNNNNK